ncbi:MAG: gliding motility protein GldL [Prolixibacteraceae bacterium]|nr:gliding motility protein GldL [Prolixibacteraceae bacterium]MBN2648265.1 gliding motility protein GldL [Prolixibacteraceae bacterium]
MNIGDFLHSKRWKLMQNYIYSWGASVVLIGALFKLEHLPGASVFLGVGLSIEAIIFFISAFEPLMELPDWKVIYPQLRTGEESERDKTRHIEMDNLYPNFFGGGGSAGGTSVANISSKELENLNASFQNLSETAKGLKKIADTTVATDNFVKNLNEASESIGTVVEANKSVSETMKKGAENISESYHKAADTVNDFSSSLGQSTKAFTEKSEITAKTMEQASNDFSGNIKKTTGELDASYKAVANSLSNGFKGLEKETGNYTSNLDKLNKNMAAINAAYELHLKGAEKVDEMVGNYSKGVEKIGKLIGQSIEETNKFAENTKEINKNIQELNSIYGRMLGALNSKS